MLDRRPLTKLFLDENLSKDEQRYRDLFVEAGFEDAQLWSFNKDNSDEEGDFPVLKISKEVTVRYPNYFSYGFEAWCKAALPRQVITREVSSGFLKTTMTYSLSDTQLELIDKVIVRKRKEKSKSQKASEIEKKQPLHIDTNTNETVAIQRHLDGTTSLVYLGLSKQIRQPAVQPTPEQREAAQKEYEAQRAAAIEHANLAEEQQKQQQKKLQQQEEEERQENAELQDEFYDFFENPETKEGRQKIAKKKIRDIYQWKYNWMPPEDHIEFFQPEKDRSRVICKILDDRDDQKPFYITSYDVDKWMEEEEEKMEKEYEGVVAGLRLHFGRYENYLKKQRDLLDPGRYLLKDSKEKLTLVEGLLQTLNASDQKTNAELLDDFRKYYENKDVEKELKKDRYKSQAISVTVSLFKMLVPPHIYSKEQAMTEGEKVVTDEKVKRVIRR